MWEFQWPKLRIQSFWLSVDNWGSAACNRDKAYLIENPRECQLETGQPNQAYVPKLAWLSLWMECTHPHKTGYNDRVPWIPSDIKLPVIFMDRTVKFVIQIFCNICIVTVYKSIMTCGNPFSLEERGSAGFEWEISLNSTSLKSLLVNLPRCFFH